MGTSSKTSKSSRASRINAMAAGIQKHFSNLAALQLGNASYTPAALVTLLQSDITLSNKATASRAQLTTDVQAAKASHATVDPLLRFLHAFVVGQFGDGQSSATILADFGLSPRKVPVKSADAKAKAAAQSKATRVARGTLGPKEKSKVKGVVPAEPPTTGGTAAAAPATPPAGNAAATPAKLGA